MHSTVPSTRVLLVPLRFGELRRLPTVRWLVPDWSVACPVAQTPCGPLCVPRRLLSVCLCNFFLLQVNSSGNDPCRRVGDGSFLGSVSPQDPRQLFVADTSTQELSRLFVELAETIQVEGGDDCPGLHLGACLVLIVVRRRTLGAVAFI